MLHPADDGQQARNSCTGLPFFFLWGHTFCYHVYNMYMVHVHVHVYGKGEMYIEQQWQQINHVVLAHDGNLFL